MTAPSEQKTARSPIGEFGDLILRNRVGCVAGWRAAGPLPALTWQTPRDWIEYNTVWPHSAFGCLTPTDYAEAWAAGHRTHNERINRVPIRGALPCIVVFEIWCSGSIAI